MKKLSVILIFISIVAIGLGLGLYFKKPKEQNEIAVSKSLVNTDVKNGSQEIEKAQQAIKSWNK